MEHAAELLARTAPGGRASGSADGRAVPDCGADPQVSQALIHLTAA
jgi:hypothetical protein